MRILHELELVRFRQFQVMSDRLDATAYNATPYLSDSNAGLSIRCETGLYCFRYPPDRGYKPTRLIALGLNRTLELATQDRAKH